MSFTNTTLILNHFTTYSQHHSIFLSGAEYFFFFQMSKYFFRPAFECAELEGREEEL